jgi:DNA-binding NarL/FixJ family response regulator
MTNLTDKQKAVLALIADGLTEKMIARRLGVTVNTIKDYRIVLRDKLKAKNAAHAVALAFRAGVLEVGAQ